MDNIDFKPHMHLKAPYLNGCGEQNFTVFMTQKYIRLGIQCNFYDAFFFFLSFWCLPAPIFMSLVWH